MRTPLTSLRSNVELLQRVESLPVSERGEVVADVFEDVDELSTLLAELVDLASDLASAVPEEQVSLGDLARGRGACAPTLRPYCHSRRILGRRRPWTPSSA